MKWEIPDRAYYVFATIVTALVLYAAFTYMRVTIGAQEETYERARVAHTRC